LKIRKRKSEEYKKFVSEFILFFSDLFVIGWSLIIGALFSNLFCDDGIQLYTYSDIYSLVLPIYIVLVSMFIFDGLYAYRFDFWHESRLILRGILFSFIIIFAYFSLIDFQQLYHRDAIIFSFLIMAILLPISKIIIKKTLFSMGYWKIGVKILTENFNLEKEIFDNPYLGYIKSQRENVTIVFIDSHSSNERDIENLLDREIESKNQVIFIPIFDKYHFSNSKVFELTNVRTSLVVLQNRLKSKYRIYMTILYNYILAALIAPLLLPIIGIIALKIKKDSEGPVFFKQRRLGKDGKEFLVYKFRTMYMDSDTMLQEYLNKHPEEVKNYELYHKYENDPRITRIGHFLRNTSLDEVAQIINVFKGEMNFMGPRPYMVEEKELIGDENHDIILKVNPGITGLWQVSGRSELSFQERVELDRWYIQNWSMWMDFVIFLKTIYVVLNRAGAR